MNTRFKVIWLPIVWISIGLFLMLSVIAVGLIKVLPLIKPAPVLWWTILVMGVSVFVTQILHFIKVLKLTMQAHKLFDQERN